MNSRFVWLLRREWMQHRVGWLGLAAAPLVITLLLLPFAEVRGDLQMPRGNTAAAVGLFAYLNVALLLIGASAAFQAASTARRDQQDRSVEFWMSLPVGPVQGVGATVLMHLLVMPVLLVALSFVAGQLVALGTVARFGQAGLAQDVSLFATTSWWAFGGMLLVRCVLGLVMAALWLSPLLLAVMAASVWLKRWGVPVVGLVAFLGSWLLWKLTGVSLASDAVSTWVREAGQALLPVSATGADTGTSVRDIGAWTLPWDMTVSMLRSAASPYLAAGLLIATAFFFVLVWRRVRC